MVTEKGTCSETERTEVPAFIPSPSVGLPAPAQYQEPSMTQCVGQGPLPAVPRLVTGPTLKGKTPPGRQHSTSPAQQTMSLHREAQRWAHTGHSCAAERWQHGQSLLCTWVTVVWKRRGFRFQATGVCLKNSGPLLPYSSSSYSATLPCTEGTCHHPSVVSG